MYGIFEFLVHSSRSSNQNYQTMSQNLATMNKNDKRVEKYAGNFRILSEQVFSFRKPIYF